MPQLRIRLLAPSHPRLLRHRSSLTPSRPVDRHPGTSRRHHHSKQLPTGNRPTGTLHPVSTERTSCEVHVATIVVAEDERDLNGLVRRHLEDEGHRVVQVFDGAEAVAAVHRERPDLLILDWMLPKL